MTTSTSYALTIVLILSAQLLLGQKHEKAEDRALTCFEKQLIADGLSKGQILKFHAKFGDAFRKRDSAKMRQLVNEVDSLMQKAGYVVDGSLVPHKWKHCMVLERETAQCNTDTFSAFCQFIAFLDYMETNPKLMENLAPTVKEGGLRVLMGEIGVQHEFYDLYYHSLLLAIMSEKRQVFDVKPYSENLELKRERQMADALLMAKQDEDPLYLTVETMPKYPGGDRAIRRYFMQELHKTIDTTSIEGVMFLRLTVERDGSVSDVISYKKHSPETEAEIRKIAMRMSGWKAGMQNGEKVRVGVTAAWKF